MNPLDIYSKYYSPGSDAYKILYSHSRSVADKALTLARMHPEMQLDTQFLEEAALLHDIGIFLCNAPGIDCHGSADYICHGYLGADLLRKENTMEKHALVCERHTGAGITLQEIVEQQLPLPHREMVPVSLEEKLICFADKFFSKTHLEKEKSIDKIKRSLSKYGNDTIFRFEEMCKLFLGE
ncbi:MAG: HDIG domain-containing protein [Tannerellaceae bacterium]|nr:HDIG domain-containing protein [Tannerellaceae bacterium]